MDVSDERIKAMLRGRREVRMVPLPGFGDGELLMVGIRVLLEDEIDAARANATQYAKAIAAQYRLDVREMLSIDAEVLDREVQRQLVYRAFLNADGDGEPKPFFDGIGRVRQLDTVMLQTLFNLYLDHQNYVSPLRGLDEDDVAGLVAALKKTPETEALLGLYDARTLRSLSLTLASELRTALIGK
jgi:hypothetical protein